MGQDRYFGPTEAEEVVIIGPNMAESTTSTMSNATSAGDLVQEGRSFIQTGWEFLCYFHFLIVQRRLCRSETV